MAHFYKTLLSRAVSELTLIAVWIFSIFPETGTHSLQRYGVRR